MSLEHVLKGLEHYVSDIQNTFFVTLDDLKTGLVHGAAWGATGAYCYGLQGASIGFASGVMLNILTSPSYASWKKFVTSKVPSAIVPKEKFSFSWQSAAILGGTLLGSLVLSKKGASDFFDVSALTDLHHAWFMKQQGTSGEMFSEFFANTVQETAKIAWRFSWVSYLAFQANKAMSLQFLSHQTKDVQKYFSLLKAPFSSPDMQIKTYELLASKQHAYALYSLQKSFLAQGQEKESLGIVLQYYFKDELKPFLSSSPHVSKKELMRFAQQHKSSLDLFVAHLLFPVDDHLVSYYADLAVADAKKQNDVAALSLLATYQSYVHDTGADATWKDVASLVVKHDFLEEKLLGEGNSGGASQLLFEGAVNDPLRWSLVMTKGDADVLEQKYLLGAALTAQSISNKNISDASSSPFVTPRMISLVKNDKDSYLFRQQLWGLPLDEFSLQASAQQSVSDVVSLYATICDNIFALQDLYQQQSAVSFPLTSWEEKFLSKENDFYDLSLLQASLDLLYVGYVQGETMQLSANVPIVDPFVRNIGVHQKPDGSRSLSFWDVEVKSQAPRVYDLATLLLTAKPYLLPESFTQIRSTALDAYQQRSSFSKTDVLGAYAGAVVLRFVALLKAWSNETKQQSMLSLRPVLLASAKDELTYITQQSVDMLSSYAQDHLKVISSLDSKLPFLAERFSV